MDPKELCGLMEAYSEVYAPQEEIDEASYSAKAARAGKDIGKPGKAFAKIAKEAGKRYGSKERGEKVAGAVLAKLRAEDVEIDEAVKGANTEMRKAASAERRGGDRPLSKKVGDANAAHMARKVRFADKVTKAKGHMPGYTYGEEVEQVDENRYAMRNPEEYERAQRKPRQKSERERRMNDPHIGINSPAFQQFMRQQMGSSGGGKKKTNEEVDIFDVVLEFLQVEGYAETEKDALFIMANLSEEEILEYRKLAAGLVGGMMALNMMKPGIPSPQHKTPTPERERTELPSRRSAEDSRRMAKKLKAEYDADQAKMDQSIKRDKEVRDNFYRNR